MFNAKKQNSEAKPIFTNNSDAALLRYAEHIFLKMTEHEDLFPAPTPDLTVLETSITAYRDAYDEAPFRDKRAVILKQQRADEVQEVHHSLSQYEDAMGPGDPRPPLPRRVAQGPAPNQRTQRRT